MSGTSFDGVDAALIKTNGLNSIELIDTSYVEYTTLEKNLYNSSIIKNYKKITNTINDKHISAIIKPRIGSSIKSICFNCINSKIGDYLLSYKNTINIIGQIQENVWNNKKNVQLNIKDIIL